MRVVVVGGTHGNEWTGVYLAQALQAAPEKWRYPGLNLEAVLANPQAIQAVRRYIDTDLNRCFLPADLANPELQAWEQRRAKELQQQFQPQGPDSAPDWIIDLHSTTAAMGLALIISRPALLEEPLMRRILAHLVASDPQVRVVLWPSPGGDSPYLPSQGQRDLTLEVGPIAQGTLDADLYLRTQTLLQTLLSALSNEVQEIISPPPITEFMTYTIQSALDYPRHANGSLAAMIHPQRQNQDYQPLQPGDPLFMSFTGENIVYQGAAGLCPVFINEQAYYEKGIALMLACPALCVV
jgi:succinylglutamate desuccinylase